MLIHITSAGANKETKNSLKLTLFYGKTKIESSGRTHEFDYELMDIQLQIPTNMYLKNCWNCAKSEYMPFQKTSFGHMGCFRDFKNSTMIRHPMDLVRIWSNITETVNELHQCSSFVRRTKAR